MQFLWLTLSVLLYWEFPIFCLASESWNRFATSSYYSNIRMLIRTNLFAPQYFSKDIPRPWVAMNCANVCGSNTTCLAFNLYENEAFYICEPLSDNLCQNLTTKALIEWPGSTLVDKLISGQNEACLNSKFGSQAVIPCETLRPGCFGNWPNCFNCLKTCIDCKNRYTFNGVSECTLWPEGTGPYLTPVFGLCFDAAIYFLRRQIDKSTGQIKMDYRMSLEDMSRMVKLKLYSTLQFYFSDSAQATFRYNNISIDSKGTLSNLTFLSSNVGFDLLDLKGIALQPTSFVTVVDDRYGCGSFWLIDTSNATYCPGGKIAMLGTLRFVNGQMDTGIRIQNTVYTYTSLSLLP